MSTIKERSIDKNNPYNTFGKKNFFNANTGEEVRMSSENWDNPLANGIAIPTESNPSSTWNIYLNKLPSKVSLGELTLEQFGDNPKLIAKYYKKSYMVEPIQLAQLPTETLEFLVNMYN